MGIKYVTLYDSPFSENANKMLVQGTLPIGYVVRSAEELDCNKNFGGVWEKLSNEVINEVVVYRYRRIR